MTYVIEWPAIVCDKDNTKTQSIIVVCSFTLVFADAFRGYLNSALKIFNSRPYLLNERARTTFRKGRLFRLMGMGAESEKLLLEAYTIRKQLEPRDTRPLEQLKECDFDVLVTFWSR